MASVSPSTSSRLARSVAARSSVLSASSSAARAAEPRRVLEADLDERVALAIDGLLRARERA